MMMMRRKWNDLLFDTYIVLVHDDIDCMINFSFVAFCCDGEMKAD